MKRPLGLVLFLLLSCTTATVPGPASPVHLVIVGTTDVHGWFAGHTEVPREGGESIRYGGLAVLASYVGALRAANPGRVVLVDIGDMFQGTLESNLFEGEPVVKAYNALGYSAAAVGNHEFDYGPVGPDTIARTPDQNPLGALERNASLMRFPLLAANVTEKATGSTPAWAHRSTLIAIGGVRLGIIGLSTPDTPNITMLANVDTLKFTDPVAATIGAAADLRARGADAVIVLGHMGGRCKDMNDVHDVASCETDQEAMDLLDRLPPGTIDAYFAGHTHAQMRQVINGVAAVEALPYSRDFSTIDLWIDPSKHRVERTGMRPHTMLCTAVYAGTETCDPKQAKPGQKLVPRVFEGRTMTPDAKVAAILEPYLRQVSKKRNEPLGVRTSAPFTRSYLREASLGDLLADALRAASGADVAFVNSGSVRADLRAGDLVYADVFDVSPFDNYPSIVTMTGEQLTEALRLTTTGERGIMQVSGLRYTFDEAKDADKPQPQRKRLVSVVRTDGLPLDPNARYRVAMPDFLSAGGDGLMPVIKTIPKENITTDQSAPMLELFIAALKQRGAEVGPLTPKKDGRITVLNPTPANDR